MEVLSTSSDIDYSRLSNLLLPRYYSKLSTLLIFAVVICKTQGKQSVGKKPREIYLSTECLARASTIYLVYTSIQVLHTKWYIEDYMAQQEVEELVVHLENTMDLSRMELEIKLVGAVLVNRQLNRWGMRNILCSAWKEFREIKVKWVHDNLYIITVPNEAVADKILGQVPWAVMK